MKPKELLALSQQLVKIAKDKVVEETIVITNESKRLKIR